MFPRFEGCFLQVQCIVSTSPSKRAAERYIHTFKNHFISTLCTVDSNYPLAEWDRLLPQTLLTLNLLLLSAHASLLGNYDFNRVPIAPPGTKIVAHVAADSRTTFGQHGKVGWYIGPSPEHYRCYKSYFSDTMKERDVLKVDFPPEKIPFPKFTPEEAYLLHQTAEDMLHLLKASTASPTAKPLSFSPPILNAFAKVADILGRVTAPPPSPLPLSVPLFRPSPPLPVSTTTASPTEPIRPILPVPIPTSPLVTPHNVSTPRVPITPNPITPPNPIMPHHLVTPRKLIFAQSAQHDPTIADKMFNLTTDRAETIDSLIQGPKKNYLEYFLG
jgi:hypothetical protein